MYLPPNSDSHYPSIEGNSYEGKLLYRKATYMRASRMINHPAIPKNH